MKKYLRSSNGKVFRMFDEETCQKVFVTFGLTTEIVLEALSPDQVPSPDEMERRFIEMNQGAMEITKEDFNHAFVKATALIGSIL